MGHLIPAGSGFDCHRDIEVEFTVEEPEPVFHEPVEAAEEEGARSLA